ncbi:protein ANTI-SILENCING 1 [Eutrema salsugineum]|uniref:protein ANTI-SILENCING 1 n=1 Tax=Eutrema salsugineum TaxID=72664 RepID=UPI000CED7357|nr:protein ANTI-SILENCING 1 [Eutrema salsugineum]
MEESAGADEGLEFKWGKKRGVGGTNKEVQFYESFTFDGDDYCLYDCVLVGDANEPEGEPFVGKIIKIWEHTNKRFKNPRKVKILWFIKPSEISPDVLKGVPDLLPNELFLASGEGVGVANVNKLEAIWGKCSVLCISKDKRNPQPADEKIKSADFVFRRAFDVGSLKFLNTIDDKIAGVDVKFIFNRAGSKKEETAVQKIEADRNGNLDSLKPNGLPACGSVRKTEDNSIESSDCRGSSYDRKEGKEKGLIQLATKESTLAEEKSNKDSGVQEGTAHKERDSCEASGSMGNHCDGKAQDSEVKKQFTKQKSMPPEERYSNTCEASGSSVNHSNAKKAQVNDVRKQLTKQKSMPAEERYSRESNDRPQKKQKLDGCVTVPDGRNTNMMQNTSSAGKGDRESFKRPRDKVTGDGVSPEKPSFVKKKRDLGVSVSEGKDANIATEKVLSKKPSFDGRLLKRAEDNMLADDYKRNYQVIEVSRKPEAVNSKWFRPLPWEESMREAEKEARLVLLQNLDPTFTSDEVQDIVYSALNEQCTARIIERTSVIISHFGQALVIFNSREAAQRAIVRLDEGCLLLSNGRPLVAAFAKINPPGKPPSFCGHIKPLKTQMRRETRDTVATSHCSQPNTLEYEMAMEWCLHQAKSDHALKAVSKRQLEERKSLRINFKPKLP